MVIICNKKKKDSLDLFGNVTGVRFIETQCMSV